MRDVRLGRQFDAVLVHDAVMYMTEETDLIASVKTAAVHCKPDGVALFLPDFVRETFTSGIHHGGHDAQGRGLRYLEWTFDPDPSDTTYTVDFAIIIRDSSGVVRFEHDQHVFGLFGRQTWLTILTEAGFAPRLLHDDWDREVFAGHKGLEPPKG
jgi:hypothetical protein